MIIQGPLDMYPKIIQCLFAQEATGTRSRVTMIFGRFGFGLWVVRGDGSVARKLHGLLGHNKIRCKPIRTKWGKYTNLENDVIIQNVSISHTIVYGKCKYTSPMDLLGVFVRISCDVSFFVAWAIGFKDSISSPTLLKENNRSISIDILCVQQLWQGFLSILFVWLCFLGCPHFDSISLS